VAVAKRVEKARRQDERQAQRRAAESKADQALWHVEKYLKHQFEYDALSELYEDARRLRAEIREFVIDELLEDPTMTDRDLQNLIEDEVDEHM
jgi:hypothetical protein